MKIVFLIVFLFFYIFFPFFRMFLKNLHYEYYYLFNDIAFYIKEKRWRLFGFYGIDLFIGMFGHGKTLSMVHRTRLIYKQYGNSIRIFSNIHLKNIPYIPLVNFNQLLEIGEEEEKKYVGTIVLIDEVEAVLNNRNYANFPLQLLGILCQQRKRHVYIMATCQRFFMCDKLFRSISTNAIDCKKIWRWQNVKYYDAWDYENAVNSQILRPKQNKWWFVRNADYDSYDTELMITNKMAEDFISNDETIVRTGLDYNVNYDAIKDKHIRKSVRTKRNAKMR